MQTSSINKVIDWWRFASIIEWDSALNKGLIDQWNLNSWIKWYHQWIKHIHDSLAILTQCINNFFNFHHSKVSELHDFITFILLKSFNSQHAMLIKYEDTWFLLMMIHVMLTSSLNLLHALIICFKIISATYVESADISYHLLCLYALSSVLLMKSIYL